MMPHYRRIVRRLVNPVLKSHSPDFLIIGAQKAGTTTLHHWLSEHPGIKGSYPKELDFFGDRIKRGFSENWYESHFTTVRRGEFRFFESSPQYLYYPCCASSISALYPKIRLVVVLREPVSRAWSAWNMYNRLARDGEITRRGLRGQPKPLKGNRLFELLIDQRGSMRPFGDCLEVERELMVGDPNRYAIEPSLLRRGLYSDQLERYEQLFPRDQLLVLGFNELIKRPQATMHKLCKFLEVPQVEVKAPVTKNANSYFKEMDDRTRDWLEKFYERSNRQIFSRWGELDW